MNVNIKRVYHRLLTFLRLPRGSHQGRRHRLSQHLQLEGLEARDLLSGTWSTLANLAPAGTGTMMLLPNGTVMAEGPGQTSTWYKLTPNAAGSYQSGTWSTLASMHQTRLYFGSNVLPDGRVFIVGGEYSSAGSFTRTGETYNPSTNTWTTITNFPQSQFGDDPTIVLPDGRVLGGYLGGPQTYIYNPTTDTWTATGTKLRSDRSDEETWIKLPDDSVLSYDVFGSTSTVGHAQRYIPSTGTWVDAGNLPVVLSSSAVGSELGPGFLLPDGRVFQLGANGNTAFYTPATNSWVAGPVIPNGLGCDDAPGAMLPNGKVLFAADHISPLFTGPTSVFEFDPTTNTYTNVTPSLAGFSLSGAAFTCRMLVLPTGQILMTSGGSRLALYTPDGAADPTWQPAIAAITDNGNGSFTLTGTQLNGLSQGASYGDDAEMDTNYPIVRFTNGTSVYYARSYNWSSTGVATGSTVVTTQFVLPSGIPLGQHYNVQVIASGIASNNFGFDVGQPPVLTPVSDQTIPSTQQVLTVALSATGTAPLTYTATAQSLAYVVTQMTGTLTYNSAFDNWGGRNEKWFQNPAGQWYFILSDGTLYQWDGSSQATGTSLGNVGPSYYTNPTLLTSPPVNQPHATVSVSGNTLTITRDRTWTNGIVVTATVSNSFGSDSKNFNVFVTPATGRAPALSPIADQTIPPTQQVLSVALSATGTAPLTYTATAQSLAYVVTQMTGTLTYNSTFDNWGGRNEKWLLGASGQWYFILPDGTLYQWDGSSQATGTSLGNVGLSYYTNPTLLTNPPVNQPHATVSVSGNTLTVTRDLTWTSGIVVTVTVSNSFGSDSKTFNVFVTP
jgi:hypothetical protein